MNFNNLRIGTRLSLGFGVVLALLVTLVLVGLSSLASINGYLVNVVDNNNVKLAAATNMRDDERQIAIGVRNLVMLTDAAERAEQSKKIMKAREDYARAAAILQAKVKLDSGKAILARIEAARNETMPLMDKAAKFGLDNKAQDGTRTLIVEVAPAAAKWLSALEEMIDQQAGLNKDAEDAAALDYANTRLMMATLGAISVVIGMLIAWLSTRSITRPMIQAVKIAQTVAAGDLSILIDVGSRDETGQLLQALKDMNSSLQKIVGQVRSGTDTIATASGQIAAGNLDLSSRTEQQASALEETASSMEELTATVKQNGDNARQANQLAAAASDVAIKGGTVVAHVVDTMGSINESAKKIVDIIGVIDGIAFQTNILALNAAVEAARAGEQGRGFAVVASEVRNLAQRSAAAAKEIKTLIGNSVEQVELGSKLVGQAGSTMDDIVASVRRVTDIMGEIASASREQEAGIGQINTAITEMDAVTQQNAALVEEAAAASHSLQEQAGNLAQVVSVFTLGGANAGFAAPNGRKSPPNKVAPLRTKAAVTTPSVLKITAETISHAKRSHQGTAKGEEWEQF